jgi:hypothetical protein
LSYVEWTDARPGAPTDGHTRPIGVDSKLLAGKPVITLRAADLEGAPAP